ncbi:MAG: hypothetical protein LBL69_01535, partial [Zoogloeaceae bacterium]|nr:hypothetical protein [Zoogloeaceae bacterium]
MVEQLAHGNERHGKTPKARDEEMRRGILRLAKAPCPNDDCFSTQRLDLSPPVQSTFPFSALFAMRSISFRRALYLGASAASLLVLGLI